MLKEEKNTVKKQSATNGAGFKPVSPQVDFPKLEQNLLSYWKENKIFEKSIESRSKDKKWTFLDGPPFVTGVPHYGSLLSSIPKDVFGRYFTMKGYKVRRVWGWDGHGLPIENKVESELGVKSKKDIERKVGIQKFIEACKKYVEQVPNEWEWYVDHIGRWVDFKNAYRTWDISYMESVMWVFKQLYDKGYIYKGLRVTLYCPHCSTPISNFEVAMDSDNYKDVEDFSTIYKYALKDERDTYVLAWSTTPWTKIVTSALAVNPKLSYVKVKQGDQHYILAQSTLKILGDKPYEIEKEFAGKDLVGKKFEPHYDYYSIKPGEKAFEIIGGDFVTDEEGVGVVTVAAYGEEDLKAMSKQNIHIETHLDEEGNVLGSVPIFGGMYYLKANKAVNEDLASRNLIYKDEQLSHSIPLCWRCSTRLYYAPIDAWYVDVRTLKPAMKKTNEKVNWFPKHFKTGRFLKSFESAPDWNISRNRYWGSPVPVWECECGERFVPGSIAELEEASGRKIEDLHKPFIDEVSVKCKKCGKQAKRTSEVLDSWIEAGSASFAERHFPFQKRENLEDFFPTERHQPHRQRERAVAPGAPGRLLRLRGALRRGPPGPALLRGDALHRRHRGPA
ncbi:MAG: class I tRNA ligase family protein, partial [Candidatus Levybacteria bacterium]|nr:class I tRNA ligase family protein [Candidatus Levybacteria bacterium]